MGSTITRKKTPSAEGYEENYDGQLGSHVFCRYDAVLKRDYFEPFLKLSLKVERVEAALWLCLSLSFALCDLPGAELHMHPVCIRVLLCPFALSYQASCKILQIMSKASLNTLICEIKAVSATQSSVLCN